MADLEITGLFDSSPIVEGIQSAAQAMQAGAEQIVGSFQQIGSAEEALEAAGTGASSLIAELTGIGSAADTATTELPTLQQGLVNAGVGASSLVEKLTGIEPGAVSAASGFTSLESGLVSAGTGASVLLEQLTGISAGINQLTTSISTLPEVVDESAVSLTTLGEGLATLDEGFAAAASGADSFIESVQGAVGAVEVVGPQVEAMDAALLELATAQEAAAQSASQLSEAEQAITPSTQGVAESLFQQDEALAAMQDSQVAAIQSTQALASAQAEAMATLQELAVAYADVAEANAGFLEMQEAQVAAIEEATQAQLDAANAAVEAQLATQAAATAAQKQTIAQAEASAAARQYHVAVAEGVTVNRALASAIAFLNNEQAVLKASDQETAAALEVVRAQAQRLGLQLIETAQGFQLVAAAEGEVTAASTGMQSALAYASARLGAYETGLGAVGFALGTVGRASETLAPILSAAFPIVGAIALIGILDTLAEKFEKAQEEVTKTIVGFDDLAASSEEVANSLEIQNLKMDDTISKLQGGVEENKLKEAILENVRAVDQLNQKLEEGTKKAVQLLEGLHTSIFGAVVTGQRPTELFAGIGNIYGDLEDKKRAYEEAIATQRALDAAYQADKTEANRKAASDQAEVVRNAGTAAYDELEKQQKNLNDKIKELEKPTPVTLGPTGPLSGPSIGTLSRPKGEIEAEFRSEKIALADLTTQYYADKQAVDDLTKSEEKRTSVAGEEIASQRRTADKTVTESSIKAEEDAAQKTLELAKRTADEKLKAQQAEINLEIQQAIAGGASKQAAQIAADDKILAARKAHLAALISAQQDYVNAERSALEEQFEIEEKDLVGPQKEAAETTTIQKIKDILNTGNAEIARLEEEGSTQEKEVRTKSLAEMVSASEQAYKRIIDSQREQSRVAIQSTAQQYSEEERLVKDATDIKMRDVAAEEATHVITTQQAFDKRKAILDEERAEIKFYSNEHVVALQKIEDEVQFLIQYFEEIGVKADDIKPLITTYDQITNAINKAKVAQQNLNDQLDSKEIDLAIQKWKEQEQVVSTFVSSATNDFNSFVENAITSGHTLKQDLNQAFLEIDRSFIKMILDMIEKSALFQTVEGKIQGALNAIFRIPQSAPNEIANKISSIPLGPAPASVQSTLGVTATGPEEVSSATTTSAQIVALQTQTNAQLAALYQQDLAAYMAAQAQKIGQTTVGETTKTAATSTGEATRTGIITAGTTTQTSQEATKVATHVAGETAKTGATATGEAQRQSFGVIGLTKELGVIVEKVAKHIVGETEKTTTTQVSQATQTASVETGEGIRLATVETENKAEVFSDAGLAAAAAFASVMEALPFPVNVATAPGVAASAFGQTVAFGAFATGGIVMGPGSSTSDSIPAMLSAGEYVIQAEAVKKIGVPALNLINQGFSIGGQVLALGMGGLVGASPMMLANGGYVIQASVGLPNLEQLDRGITTTNNTSQNNNFNLSYSRSGVGTGAGNTADDARRFADMLQKELRRRNILPG